MEIAVTGGSGHLGSNLIRSLNQRGIKPRVLVHEDSAGFNDVDVIPINGDINHLETLNSCFQQVDIVYHLAARISLETNNHDELQIINVNGTRNVITACLQNNVKRLVHISSIHAFNQYPIDQPIDEKRALVTKGFPYDKSKADGVREVEAAIGKGLNAIIIFPTGLIGPYDYKISHMGKFFLDLYHGKLPMLINGGYNFVDIRDTAEAIILAAEKAQKGERYLLGGHYVSIRQFAELVSEITGIKTPKLFVPIPLLKSMAPIISLFARITKQDALRRSVSPVALDILHNYPGICYDKSIRELGFKPRPVRDTIEAIYAWFAEAGLL